jgi:hypothetical protein
MENLKAIKLPERATIFSLKMEVSSVWKLFQVYRKLTLNRLDYRLTPKHFVNLFFWPISRALCPLKTANSGRSPRVITYPNCRELKNVPICHVKLTCSTYYCHCLNIFIYVCMLNYYYYGRPSTRMWMWKKIDLHLKITNARTNSPFDLHISLSLSLSPHFLV